jgi:hypothetical protein
LVRSLVRLDANRIWPPTQRITALFTCDNRNGDRTIGARIHSLLYCTVFLSSVIAIVTTILPCGVVVICVGCLESFMQHQPKTAIKLRASPRRACHHISTASPLPSPPSLHIYLDVVAKHLQHPLEAFKLLCFIQVSVARH